MNYELQLLFRKNKRQQQQLWISWTKMYCLNSDGRWHFLARQKYDKRFICAEIFAMHKTSECNKRHFDLGSVHQTDGSKYEKYARIIEMGEKKAKILWPVPLAITASIGASFKFFTLNRTSFLIYASLLLIWDIDTLSCICASIGSAPYTHTTAIPIL